MKGGILRHHGVLHQGGHEKSGSKRQVAPVTYYTKEHLTALIDIDVVTYYAVGNNSARPNNNIITDGRGPLDDGRGIYLATSTYLDQFRAGEELLMLPKCAHE